MDAISAGSGVLAFLVLGFKSAKAAHEIVSSIRDGPELVRQLTNDITQLQALLDQIGALPNDVVDSGNLSTLYRPTRHCCNDLKDMAKDLEGLGITPAECRVGKLWKRVKVTMGERALERMRGTIRSHTATLTLCLTVGHTAHMMASRAQRAEMMELLRQTRCDMSSFQQALIPRAHDGPKGAVTPAAFLSPTAAEMAPDGSTNASLDADATLEQAVSRLITVVGSTQGTIEYDEAHQLIDDLQHLLDSASKDRSTKPASTTPRTGSSHDISREMGIIAGLVASAPSLDVACSPHQSQLIGLLKPGNAVGQSRKERSFESLAGTLTVLTNTRRIRPWLSSQYTDERERSLAQSGREFVAKVLFRPRNSNSNLVLNLSQSRIVAGIISSIPRISTHNIVPNDSRIFQLAEVGKVEEILYLVHHGKASLFDHDEEGRSLLHYSYRHPDLMKLLIDHGLDVNSVPTHGLPPLGRVVTHGLPACSKLLLESGADPTLNDQTFSLVDLAAAHQAADFTKYGASHLRAIVETGSHFIDYREASGPKSPVFESILSLFCRGGEPGLGREMPDKIAFSMLIRNGVRLHERNFDHRTFLHHFFSSHDEDSAKWLDLLILAIKTGADVHAKDVYGISVSDLAYNRVCNSDRFEIEHSSAKGDVWDSALDFCGYDIDEFRDFYPRRARYTPGYTRQDFEALWKGREDECWRYWDDKDYTNPIWHGGFFEYLNWPPTICMCVTPHCKEFGYTRRGRSTRAAFFESRVVQVTQWTAYVRQIGSPQEIARTAVLVEPSRPVDEGCECDTCIRHKAYWVEDGFCRLHDQKAGPCGDGECKVGEFGGSDSEQHSGDLDSSRVNGPTPIWESLPEEPNPWAAGT